jgi:hypothetical protein
LDFALEEPGIRSFVNHRVQRTVALPKAARIKHRDVGDDV